MTSDGHISHIEDRIKYWEGIAEFIESVDHPQFEILRREWGIGGGSRVKAQVRMKLKVSTRLSTLRAELIRLNMGQKVSERG